MKTTDVSRFSAWLLAVMLGLAIAACDDKKEPEIVDTGTPGPLKVESIIADPKVGLPGDTLVFTAVITSPSQNIGDYPTMQWTATGGTFMETAQQTVRWVAPSTPGVFTITAKASNDVGSATGNTIVYVGDGQTLITSNAGQIDLIGAGPDFNCLVTPVVTFGTETYQYIGGVFSNPIPLVPPRGLQLNTTYSPDGTRVAFAADTTYFASSVRPRHIYVGTFAAGTYVRLTVDASRPGNPERNVYNYPSFSPNGQVVAYQRWAQSWDGVATDSFHVYIHDLVAGKQTKVTYEHEFPRGFFPTFSTDGNWLVYVADLQRNGQWDIYGSPMSGNDVDGSLASIERFTDTGGLITTGVPRTLPKPPMTWNPVSPVLAVAAADNALYLIATTATGANVTALPEVNRAQEIVWSPNGTMLAATYPVTDDDGGSHSQLVTVTPAGVVTNRVLSLAGDVIRDMTFSPDESWILFRVARGGGSWFAAMDLTGTKLTEPVSVTATDPVGAQATYRSSMSLRPLWTGANLMIYPSWGTSANNTPGIFTRDLNGLAN